MRVLIVFLFLILSFESFGQLFKKRKNKMLEVHRSNSSRSYQGNWLTLGNTEEDAIKELVRRLSVSKKGKELLVMADKKARLMGKSGILEVIKVGAGSITDTSLLRRYSANNIFDVEYEQKSIVYIGKNLNIFYATLDLAHELVHFNERLSFNPYQSQFNLADFIASTIEGPGGEVAAFIKECEVFAELYPNVSMRMSKCSKIWDTQKAQFSFKKAKKEFYKLGSRFHQFRRQLRGNNVDPSVFKYLSNKPAMFLSAAHNVPYPVAAYAEFHDVVGKACMNEERRLSYFKNQSKKGSRMPASFDPEFSSKKPTDIIRELEKSYNQKCSSRIN